VAGAAAELIKATGTLKDSKTALKRIVGIADDLIVEEPEHIDIAPSDVEGFIKTALDHRKDYIEAGLDEDIAREAVRYAYGGFLPTVKLEGIYSIKAQNPETTFFQEDTAYATLSLSYPLFEGGLRMAEVSEAQSKLRGAELARLKLKRDIEVEINQAFNNIEAFSAALNSYKKQLQFAEEDYNMVFEQFKYGIATTVDVIDSDASLISAQRSMMNANFDLSLAVIELKYLSGTLLEGIAY
jgi:outer membrane protein